MKYLKKIFETKSNDDFKTENSNVIGRYHNVDISNIIGETIYDIRLSKDNTEIAFYGESGQNYGMYHSQDCCESVYLYDIIGDLDDLIGSPILKASEESNSDDIEGVETYDDSHTWTFYHFATMKGYVTLRWLGESNGYYSEGVDFCSFTQDSM